MLLIFGLKQARLQQVVLNHHINVVELLVEQRINVCTRNAVRDICAVFVLFDCQHEIVASVSAALCGEHSSTTRR